jgi:uncharacterized membrane protein YhhN
MKNKIATRGFISISFIYILITLFGKADIAGFLKPFLLPFLIYWVYSFKHFPTKYQLLLALTFSWIGDCVLLFADKGELYFIIGLVAFLLSHFIYIIVFDRLIEIEFNSNKPILWIGIVLLFTYMFSFILLLLPSLGGLLIPVVVYAVTISAMLLFAIKGSLQWPNPAKNHILFGAILFVISDSILAINKFHYPIPLNSFWIMATYLSAQFFITKGVLLLNKKKTAFSI